MIRLHVGDKVLQLSWITALSMRNELDRELGFEEQRFRDTIQAMLQREEQRRLRREWKQFVSFWASEG